MIPLLKLRDSCGPLELQFALNAGEAGLWMGNSVFAGSGGFFGRA